ncbi:MAG TPA: AAA family ATPase [Pirellulales bacterium]|jgi:replicative DNA helicase|nr:AAA family ATPase [Pirellulales bacterium]
MAIDLPALGQQLVQHLEQYAHAVPAGATGLPAAGTFMDSAAFSTHSFKHEWLVEKVLVANQPGVIGGMKKTLKTSLMIDLGVSLASGGAVKFLGKFKVPKAKRVALISGESGPATLQETAKRVCHAKGLNLAELPIFWNFSVPRLSDEGDLKSLRKAIQDHGFEVVAIDPLYLSLLASNSNIQASNLYQIGPLLKGVADACLEAGATPLVIHHSRKTQGAKHNFGPMELDDLAFSGISEFARQWMLLGRRKAYEAGSGRHELWLSVGGSAGFSGMWAVDVNEGTLHEDFTGRTWSVQVRTAAEVNATEAAIKAEQKHQKTAAKQTSKDAEDRNKLLKALEEFPEGETQSEIADKAGVPRGKAKPLLAQLVEDGHVEQVKVTKGAGSAGSRQYAGFKLKQAK